jgi:hypothetical protein
MLLIRISFASVSLHLERYLNTLPSNALSLQILPKSPTGSAEADVVFDIEVLCNTRDNVRRNTCIADIHPQISLSLSRFQLISLISHGSYKMTIS